MLPVGEAAAEGVYRLVDACYEKRSLAASSNPFIRPKRTCSREAAWLPYGATQYRGTQPRSHRHGRARLGACPDGS
jgi:hypothetical protein